MDVLVQEILKNKTALTSDEIWHLTGLLQDLYREKQNVVSLPPQNIIFIGDLHGEFTSLKSIQNIIQKYENFNYVFLGDYADRGPQQIETFNLVMALAISLPKRVIMLRGNHESDEVAARYGFQSVVTREHSIDVYKHYLRIFEVLPIAAYHEDAIFACHGGVPQGVTRIEDIQSCDRRSPNFMDETLFQIVWNDPQEGSFNFRPNIRGGRTMYFGQLAFDAFMNNINAKLMFRAHEAIPEGYHTFFQGRLVSVFSASYAGRVQPKVVRLGQEGRYEPLAL